MPAVLVGGLMSMLQALNPAARELGLRPGMALNAAQLLSRDLATADYDLAAVERCQQFLAALGGVDAQIALVLAERDVVVASYALLNATGWLTVQKLRLNVAEYKPEEHYKAVKDKWIGLRTPDGR